MSFTPEDLVRELESIEQDAPAPNRYVIALSGGMDSCVLLHALASARPAHGKQMLAIHVNHQMQKQSADWASFATSFASDLGVEYVGMAVDVDRKSGLGPEAAAREARYEALSAGLEPDDWILSAHHRDDQAETLLLNLLRGSGPLGIAGIRRARPIGNGWLVRPLLDVARDDLGNYARLHGLKWIEDPSNLDSQYDRNFLRNDILPMLATRWPDVSSRIGSSARLARDVAGLLDDIAASDLAALGDNPRQLPVEGFARLPLQRQTNLIRYSVRMASLPMPNAAHVDQILTSLLTARDDAMPLVEWPGAQVRRFRDSIYLMASTPRVTIEPGTALTGEPVVLGPGLGRISLTTTGGPGLSPTIVSHGLTLRLRQGGEEIKLPGQSHTKKLKKLLQENGIVPWLRDQLPLVYAGDELVAVGDLWVSDAAAAADGPAIAWEDRPDLY